MVPTGALIFFRRHGGKLLLAPKKRLRVHPSEPSGSTARASSPASSAPTFNAPAAATEDQAAMHQQELAAQRAAHESFVTRLQTG